MIRAHIPLKFKMRESLKVDLNSDGKDEIVAFYDNVDTAQSQAELASRCIIVQPSKNGYNKQVVMNEEGDMEAYFGNARQYPLLVYKLHDRVAIRVKSYARGEAQFFDIHWNGENFLTLPVQNLAKQPRFEQVLAKVSEVTYQLEECRPSLSFTDAVWNRHVRGNIISGIDLADDTIAKKFLTDGFAYGRANCQPKKGYGGIKVSLYQDDKHAVSARSVAIGNEIRFHNYYNYVAQRKHTEIEEQKLAEAKKSLTDFINKNGITKIPPIDSLYANPFLYENITIAYPSKFTQMRSATEGVFIVGNQPLIVSEIPKGMFSKESEVVFAGRVLGNTTAKMPFGGEMLVPHLKYVDVYFCKDKECNEIMGKGK